MITALSPITAPPPTTLHDDVVVKHKERAQLPAPPTSRSDLPSRPRSPSRPVTPPRGALASPCRTPPLAVTSSCRSTQHGIEDETLSLHSLPSRHDTQTAPTTPTVLSRTGTIAAAGTVVAADDVPPNGGYGWICTACVFLIYANTWGVLNAWGVFLNYYLSNPTAVQHGSQFQYTLIGGLSNAMSLLISPLVVLSITRLGSRTTMLLGTALVWLALFTASYATQTWHLFLTQGVCLGTGMGFLYLTATSILPPWFSSRRSLANGIATAGTGLGGLTYNLAANRVIVAAHGSVGHAYRILAFSTLACNLVAALLIRDRARTAQRRQKVFGYKQFRQLEVLLVVFWGIVTELGFITLLFSMPNYASSVGLTSTQGSVAGALLSLGLSLGRPVIGYFSDAFGRINMAMATTLACALLCFALWIPATSYPLVLLFSLLAGSVCGTFWGTLAPVLADVVGLRSLTSTFNMTCFALVLPAMFAEPIAMQMASGSSSTSAGGGSSSSSSSSSADSGKGRSSSHRYILIQVFVGCMFLAGGLSLWILRSWKILDIDEARLVDFEEEQSMVTSAHEAGSFATQSGVTLRAPSTINLERQEHSRDVERNAAEAGLEQRQGRHPPDSRQHSSSSTSRNTVLSKALFTKLLVLRNV